MHIYDLIGIGFGPSNIALAIALEEHGNTNDNLEFLFIEKQASFAWHENMLLDNAHMQISFLKDLVTLRNPASRFTFLNYLHQKERLQDFINLKTFYPSRHEFNDYLSWAANHFSEKCVYGNEVIEISPKVQGHEIHLLSVRTRDENGVIHEYLARNLVISVGGSPTIPDSFSELINNPRIFHSNYYLSNVARHPEAKRIAVIGAGQSAVEIFLDLHSRSNDTQVDLIIRGHSIKPSDDSPFVNEIFNAEYTDYVFNHSDEDRAELIQEFMNTNYAAPDLALIEQIFHVLYKQKVTGSSRHRFLKRHEVAAAKETNDGIQIDLRNLDTGERSVADYDAVILATGYTRRKHETLLAPLKNYLSDFSVDRNYRLQSTDNFLPAIFLQGCCEPTHGLSDTLLSVTAIRTDEIRRALLDKREHIFSSRNTDSRLSATAS